MKNIILVVALLSIMGCGAKNEPAPSQSGLCHTCFASYPNNEPGIIIQLWQTTDGSVLACDASTPLPGISCDPAKYNCSSPSYIISSSDYWCK